MHPLPPPHLLPSSWQQAGFQKLDLSHWAVHSSLEIPLFLIFHCCKPCHRGHFILTPRGGLTRSEMCLRILENAVAAPSRTGSWGPSHPLGVRTASPPCHKAPCSLSMTTQGLHLAFTADLGPRGGPVGTADPGPEAPPLGPCPCLSRCFLMPLAAGDGHFPACTASDLFPACSPLCPLPWRLCPSLSSWPMCLGN